MKELPLRRLTRGEITDLTDKYFYEEGYKFIDDYPHSLDRTCSKILYSLVRDYKPQTCMEFGTYFGGSACMTVSALEKNKKEDGLDYEYVPFEISEGARQEAKRNVLRECGVELEVHGDVTKNLDKIPSELDFAFIDPEWDEEIAIWTYENLIPRVKKGGLVAIHDWSVSEELVYQGGQFAGIKYFIQLFKDGKMPLEKLFSVWDEADLAAQSIALSFWRKT